MSIETLPHQADTDRLALRFQPIGDLHRVAVVGHHLRLPDRWGERLRAGAASGGPAAGWPAFDAETTAPLLIVALGARALHDAAACPAARWAQRLLAELDALHSTLVLDVSAAARPDAGADLGTIVQALRRQGIRWAVGQLGDAHSHLGLWSELGPDYLLIDSALTRGVARSMRRLEIARAVVALGHAMGSTLIATEVAALDDLAALRDIGVSYAQGPLLGVPTSRPTKAALDAAVQDALHGPAPDIGSPAAQESLKTVLRNLPVVHAPTVQWHTANDEVFALFESRMDLQALPVVEGEQPVALIGRLAFMNAYAHPTFRDTAGRASCRALANPSPHIVELDAEVQELVATLMASDQRYLTEGFIVTEDGRYAGLGRADQLVRAVTELRVEAARHANPLTFLPGNIPISIHIEHLLIENIAFVACYGDLNNFKAFNDHYGYWRGDEMIRLLARIAVRNADPKRDFVGHIGGDDFLVLFQSDDWKQRCLRMIDQFESAAMRLYDDSELEAGGIEGEDRHGVLRFFGFTTLSIGALLVAPGDFEDAQDVANAAALAKHEAKLGATGLTVREVGGPAA
ncbi:EAL domain-containing protein [Variovorax sp. ZT4R33]|uniref:EAL domain-containing protein n=1 Tax=Variovorax sp. ZT4R33 TaxID=3443743 RepID=UPI003F475C58